MELFPASARDEAMAGSYALTAAGPFALDGNPAMMTGTMGAGVGYSRAKPFKNVADDIVVDHWAVGYSTGRWAVGAMRSKLDLGAQAATDETGSYIGTFESWQTSLQVGAAVEIMSLRRGVDSANRTSLRVGLGYKRIVDHLAPASVTNQGDIEGKANTLDAGFEFAARVLDGSPAGTPRMRIRLAAAFDDLLSAKLDYGEPGQTDPLLRFTHYGAALEFEFLEGTIFGPPIGLILQYELSQSRDQDFDLAIHKRGVELSFARLASVAIGYHDDEEMRIQAPTVGFGLGLGWTGLPPSFRIDYASRPQLSGYRQVEVLSLQGGWAFGS